MICQEKDTEESLELAQRIGARADHCVTNSAQGALSDTQAYRYVYGFMVHYNSLWVEVVEHCWLEHNGVIVDPSTIYYMIPRAAYFPALSYEGSVIRIDENGAVLAGYRSATRPYGRDAKRALGEAKAYAQKLASEFGPPVRVRRFRPWWKEDE